MANLPNDLAYNEIIKAIEPTDRVAADSMNKNYLGQILSNISRIVEGAKPIKGLLVGKPEGYKVSGVDKRNGDSKIDVTTFLMGGKPALTICGDVLLVNSKEPRSVEQWIEIPPWKGVPCTVEMTILEYCLPGTGPAELNYRSIPLPMVL